MAKTLIISNRFQPHGRCRMAILPDDLIIEARCKDVRGYEVIFIGGDVEYRVDLSISQKDYETLSVDTPEDYGNNEHDDMCKFVRNDIARFIAKEYSTQLKSEKIVLELEDYVFTWEDNLRVLARNRRAKRNKMLSQKETVKA